MKKIIYFIATATLFVATSCTDYLDSENLYGKSLETYYKTPTDIEEAMAGVYNAIYTSQYITGATLRIDGASSLWGHTWELG